VPGGPRPPRGARDAQLAGTRKHDVAQVTAVQLLPFDDLGTRRLPHTAAEDLLEIVIRRDEKASTLITSNRPVEDWGELLGDTAAGAAPVPLSLCACEPRCSTSIG